MSLPSLFCVPSPPPSWGGGGARLGVGVFGRVTSARGSVAARRARAGLVLVRRLLRGPAFPAFFFLAFLGFLVFRCFLLVVGWLARWGALVDARPPAPRSARPPAPGLSRLVSRRGGRSGLVSDYRHQARAPLLRLAAAAVRSSGWYPVGMPARPPRGVPARPPMGCRVGSRSLACYACFSSPPARLGCPWGLYCVPSVVKKEKETKSCTNGYVKNASR